MLRLLPVLLARSAVHIFPENLAEVAAASKAAGVADLCNGGAGFRRHLAGHLEAIVLDILHGRHVQAFLGNAGSIPARLRGHCGCASWEMTSFSE